MESFPGAERQGGSPRQWDPEEATAPAASRCPAAGTAWAAPHPAPGRRRWQLPRLERLPRQAWPAHFG